MKDLLKYLPYDISVEYNNSDTNIKEIGILKGLRYVSQGRLSRDTDIIRVSIHNGIELIEKDLSEITPLFKKFSHLTNIELVLFYVKILNDNIYTEIVDDIIDLLEKGVYQISYYPDAYNIKDNHWKITYTADIEKVNIRLFSDGTITTSDSFNPRLDTEKGLDYLRSLHINLLNR